MFTKLFECQRRFRFQGDYSHHGFAIIWMRDSDHSTVKDAGVRLDCVFDFDTVHIHAAGDDQIFLAIYQGDIPFLVNRRQVTCQEPAIPKSFCRCLGFIPVALHHRLTAQHKFSHDPRSYIAHLLVHHPRLRIQQSFAARAQFAKLVLWSERDPTRSPFRKPAQVVKSDVRHSGRKRLYGRWGHWCCTIHSHAPGGEIAL